MRDALTAKEIATVAPHLLQGAPGTERGVQLLARRDRWQSRARTGRGGGQEYPIATLPVPLRDALRSAVTEGVPAVCTVLNAPIPSLPVPSPLPPSPQPLPAVTSLADWQRRTMTARAAVLAEIDRLTTMGGSWRKGAEALVAAAQAGTLRHDLAALVPAANATGRDMDREAGMRIEKLVDRDIKALGASPLLTTWQDGLAMLAEEVAAYNNRPHLALPRIRDAHTGKTVAEARRARALASRQAAVAERLGRAA